jgi:hypothetical protein
VLLAYPFKYNLEIEILFIVHVFSSGSTCGARRATLVTSHELGKGAIVITTNRTYPWSFVTQINFIVRCYFDF